MFYSSIFICVCFLNYNIFFSLTIFTPDHWIQHLLFLFDKMIILHYHFLQGSIQIAPTLCYKVFTNWACHADISQYKNNCSRLQIVYQLISLIYFKYICIHRAITVLSSLAYTHPLMLFSKRVFRVFVSSVIQEMSTRNVILSLTPTGILGHWNIF